MSKREKLRQKLRQQPADASMQDVETLLLRFGFILSRVRGSHHIFDYDDGKRFQQLIVPLHGRRVKKFYVELSKLSAKEKDIHATHSLDEAKREHAIKVKHETARDK